ncbi:YraN family protein [Glutamicibacter uratoxydans]|uniref:YraN family protein n=1 Tax=Glutamicibacter uratoxydans TaxID=43667 RepID=UPI003D6FE77F
MTQHNQRLGRVGERVAAEYLASIGHQIIARNWRTTFGELDLISLDAGELIAIEVKTRSSDKFGTAFEAIHPEKFRRIQRLAQRWAQENHWQYQDIRVDVLCIYRCDQRWRIEHHQRVTS